MHRNVSADRFFDDVARTLAEPMPRRRAVRVIGASLVALAVPGVSPRMARAATIGASDDIGPSVCPGRTRCSTYIDPSNWPKGQKHKCCPYPAQQYRCGSNWTCIDGCAAAAKAAGGTKGVPTCSTEKKGGTDPSSSHEPKRYDCCVFPFHVPDGDGRCLPNCEWNLNMWAGKGHRCGETCCHSFELCVDGTCRRCESLGGRSCQPAKKGTTICCAKGTSCCFNATTTACCGPKQTCHASEKDKHGKEKPARCSCDSGNKCGPDCCKRGETCCGGKECCSNGETCTPQGCCPKDRAMCVSPSGKDRVCCGEGEFCFWKEEEPGVYPLIGMCKKGCAPGNKAGTQCCGTGYKQNRTKTGCVKV